MHRLRLAAAACAAVAVFGAGGTARADEGIVVPTDPAAVADTAAAIATQAVDAASGGQYQAPDGQYQPDTGQYQAPEAAPSPANINVSVRVLSPGDDGPVDQAISVAPPATGNAPAAPVTISVNVNVTTNWNVIFAPQNDTGQYHPGQDQQQNPPAELPASSPAPAPEAPPPAAAPPPVAVPPSPVAAPQPARDHWRARALARRSATAVALRARFTRGTHHRPAAAASHGSRTPVAAPAAASAPPPPPAWPQAQTAAQPVPPHTATGAPSRPAPPAPPRPPSQPEQYAGAAAGGGLSFGNVLQTLGLLLASLWVAAVGSARRLGDSARRLRGIVGPRLAKPG